MRDQNNNIKYIIRSRNIMSAEEMIEMKGAFEINDLLYVLNII